VSSGPLVLLAPGTRRIQNPNFATLAEDRPYVVATFMLTWRLSRAWWPGKVLTWGLDPVPHADV